MSSGPRDLTEGPVSRTLFAFALPSLLVNVIQVMNGTIVAIVVGQLLGEASLAATANANQVMFVAFGVIFGFSMAGTILVGQAAGRHDVDEVRRITGAAVGLFLLAGLVTGILGWIFTPQILRGLATPIEVLGPATDYLRISFLALPLGMLNMLLPSLLRGVGDAVSQLYATIMNVIILTLTCVPLINLFGIQGAALSAILASTASLIYQVAHIYRADLPIRLRGAELGLLKPDWGHARPFLSLGFPLGLSMVLMGVSQLGMMGLINREGMETAAGFGAANQIWGFLQMPAFAVSTAVSAMAAQNIGAGRWDRINRIAISGIAINFLMTGLLVLIITLFQVPLLGLFLPKGSAAIPIGAHISLLLNWTHIFMGVSTIVTSIVRSNGAVMMPLIILFFTAVILRFAIGFGGYPYWGVEAIWAAFAAHAVVGTVWALCYFHWGRWREKKLDTGIAAAEPVGDGA